ncbi:MAG: ROK family protein [Actinobacteria bacterium]|nr:ROK family protein [Actinomycetota bacterium]MTA77092.1 ROK family protein [Actinomycetota bacterium]
MPISMFSVALVRCCGTSAALCSVSLVTDLHLGIDVGGTKILGVILDPSDPREPIAVRRSATPDTVDHVVDSLRDVIEFLRADAGRRGHTVSTIGIGVPGVVDRGGVLRGAPNLLCAVDQPLKDRVEQAVGSPVLVENDANCALWAEAELGVGQGALDIVMVALGTGIGGAVMVDGRLRVGAHGFAGEPGHMVVCRDGVLCPCGRRGCWERYASGAGLAWLAQQAVGRAGETSGASRMVELAGGDPSAIRGEHVTAAADEGDGTALAVFEQFAEWVAVGIGSLINILDPDLVIIGGGLVDQSHHYLDRVRELLPAEVLGAGAHRPTPIAAASMGPMAGAIGAALLASTQRRFR